MGDGVDVARGSAPKAGAKHRGGALDVKPEATVLILVVSEVPQHFALMLGAKHCVQASRDIASDDQPRQQEHGPTIVSREVAVVHLQHRVEAHTCVQMLLDTFSSGSYSGGRRWGRFDGLHKLLSQARSTVFIKEDALCNPLKGGHVSSTMNNKQGVPWIYQSSAGAAIRRCCASE